MTLGYCGQKFGWIKMKLDTVVALGPGHIVRRGPSSPKRHTAPNFRPMSVVAKRLDGLRCHLLVQATLCYMGTQLPPKKGGTDLSPIIGPCLLWPNGWMHQDTTWYGGRPRCRRHVLDGDPAPLKGTQPTPNPRLMCIVAKRLD